MKPLKIWEPKEDEEPQHFLRMVDYGEHVIKIQAVDEQGSQLSVIAHILRHTGALDRIGSVSPALGLDLDEQGRVKDVSGK